MKQLSLGLIQYVQDYDETFPCDGTGSHYYQSGWGEEIYSYVKSAGVYACPDDPTVPFDGGKNVDSYAMNANFLAMMTPGAYQAQSLTDNGRTLAQLNAPASTVALFEVQNIGAIIYPPVAGTYQSPLGNGGYDYNNSASFGPYGWAVASDSNKGWYASGDISSEPGCTGNWVVMNASDTLGTGRHTGGANYAAADGHVKYVLPANVSGGYIALLSTSPGTIYNGSCSNGGSVVQAAGTSSMVDEVGGTTTPTFPVALTFSPV